MIWRTSTLSLLFIGSATLASAWPTSLNQIPIADIIKHRDLYLQTTAVGTERRVSGEITQYVGVLVGIGDRIEIGWDDDLDRGGSYFNGKVLLGEGSNWALSMGYQSLRKNESQSYLVGRYDVSENLRLHVGWLEDGESRSMMGMDYALNDCWTLYVDSISGRDGASTVGLNTSLSFWPGADLTVYAGIPHTRSEGITWNVILAYAAKF